MGQSGRVAPLLLVLGADGLDPARRRGDRLCGPAGQARRQGCEVATEAVGARRCAGGARRPDRGGHHRHQQGQCRRDADPALEEVSAGHRPSKSVGPVRNVRIIGKEEPICQLAGAFATSKRPREQAFLDAHPRLAGLAQPDRARPPNSGPSRAKKRTRAAPGRAAAERAVSPSRRENEPERSARARRRRPRRPVSRRDRPAKRTRRTHGRVGGSVPSGSPRRKTNPTAARPRSGPHSIAIRPAAPAHGDAARAVAATPGLG
jgi:hypothetical protein